MIRAGARSEEKGIIKAVARKDKGRGEERGSRSEERSKGNHISDAAGARQKVETKDDAVVRRM